MAMNCDRVFRVVFTVPVEVMVTAPDELAAQQVAFNCRPLFGVAMGVSGVSTGWPSEASVIEVEAATVPE